MVAALFSMVVVTILGAWAFAVWTKRPFKKALPFIAPLLLPELIFLAIVSLQ